MSFEEPTYEEYKSATGFARFRYKYGLFVTIACWFCLVFIIYYMVSHAEILAENPLVYGTGEAKLQCECIGNQGANDYIHFFVNGSSMWLPEPIGTIYPTFTEEELKELEELFAKD